MLSNPGKPDTHANLVSAVIACAVLQAKSGTPRAMKIGQTAARA
jgi:hypothetical protein